MQAPEPERAAQDALGAGAQRRPRGAAGRGVAAAGRVSQQRPPGGEVQDPHHKGTVPSSSSIPPHFLQIGNSSGFLLPEGP